MASDDRPSDDLKPRRRGKAPTITLEAQEIAPTPETENPATPAGESAGGPSPETGPTLSPGETVAGPAPETPADASPADDAAATADPAPQDSPSEGPIPLVTGGIDPEPVPPATEEPPGAEPPPVIEPPPAEAPPPAAPPPREDFPSREEAPAGGGFGRLVAAGLVGALLTGGLAAGAQMAGYWPAGPRQDTGSLEQRLATLDARVRQIADRPAASTAAPAVDLAPVTRRIESLDEARAALETRIAALEQRPAATGGGSAAPAAPPVDLAPLRTEIDALKTAVEAVAAAQRERPAAPATPAAPAIDMTDVDRRIAAAVSPQSTRIAEIAGSVQMLQAEVKATAATAAATGEKVAALEAARTEAGDAGRRAALVVGIGALRAAVDRGQPFAAELKAAQALGLPAQAEALQAHAERGLRTTGALAQRFTALSPALMRAAPGPASEGTLLERLTASAQSLVRIRPVGEAAGDDVPTVIARIEAKLRRGDLAGALADFDRLPEPVRALGADWHAEARARATAETTLRRLSAEAAGALSGG